MSKLVNFQDSAPQGVHCSSCGALVNPAWAQCLSCKVPLSGKPVQPANPRAVSPSIPTKKTAVKSTQAPANLDPQDWIDFYQERAAFIEFDGIASREQAERLAYEAAVAGLSWAWPTNYPQDKCGACGAHLGPQKGLPLADKAIVCNNACHHEHMRLQRERAERQLTAWDIRPAAQSDGA